MFGRVCGGGGGGGGGKQLSAVKISPEPGRAVMWSNVVRLANSSHGHHREAHHRAATWSSP